MISASSSALLTPSNSSTLVLQNKSNNFTATLPQKIEKDSYISIENGESKVSFKLNGVSTQKDSRIMALDESLLSEEDKLQVL